MKILVLDNYDSFVYNLVHMLRELGENPAIFRNDKIALEEVANYDKILLSPGPGIPEEAGVMLDLIREYAHNKSILGVCLGHQAIGEAFGAKLYNLPEVLHGISSENQLTWEYDTLFEDIVSPFKIAHYHSWVIDEKSLTEDIPLKITGRDLKGNIMSILHEKYAVRGVQFHPESILTENGKKIIENWLKS